ncbi:MAG: hypothetical protein JWO49_2406 [Arthrobacter sp.]|nr:hypothetical protein [Arthrobacter sp.]MCU1548082.1 hypothetical protein [Arthrobacter sp.]
MDEVKPPSPHSNDGVGLGVAILTTFVYNDPQAFTAITSDLPGGMAEALAALGNVSEAVLGVIAEVLEVSKEEALERIAAAFAFVD